MYELEKGQDHVFFFTHGRIVGGGEEQRGRLVDYTEDFVEWANQPDVNVHAVFVGHWHQNHLFYNVSAVNIDNPPDLYDDITIGRNPIVYFSDINPNPDKGEINSPAYIESANST